MGRNVAKQVLQQERKYEYESLQRYIQELGDDLTKRSHRPNLIYRFTVLDNPAVNAFALPGGHIFIYRGLLAHFNSEEELAAVLAHEIGHMWFFGQVGNNETYRAALDEGFTQFLTAWGADAIEGKYMKTRVVPKF